MEYRIQSLVFPSEDKHRECRDLFFRGDAEVLPEGHECGIRIEASRQVSFATYFNGCTYSKWKKYAGAEKLTVHLELTGGCSLSFLGFSPGESSPAGNCSRVEFKTIHCAENGRQTISYTFPESDEEVRINGFEITAESTCILFGGYYTAEISREFLNPVELCIATTTYRNEKLIRRNIELIRDELLKTGDDIGKHLYLHVVDNGQTLETCGTETDHIMLHPNSNSGGAGGFARGMIESVHQNPEATHVLLMDDDVLVLPESIRRTYHMLRLLKPEYRKYLISGAMLFFEEPYRQYEDIGTLTPQGGFRKLKPEYDHRRISDNVLNEAEGEKEPFQYAAWWYCCIPAAVIREKGYPLPVFIRCDDMEYGIRADTGILTLNGICIWHKGFFRRFNASVDLYQRCRNLLIAKACTERMSEIDAEGFVRNCFRAQLLKYNYDSAELVLRAMEDFLKGPGFLAENRGEKILKENARLNDQLVSLDHFRNIQIDDLYDCLRDVPRKPLDKWLYRITCNGHRFWPEAWLDRKPAIISFDQTYQPGKMALRKYHLMVNPYEKTGRMLEIDKKKYRELQRKFTETFRTYRKSREILFRQYREAKPRITGESFWREYLDIPE